MRSNRMRRAVRGHGTVLFVGGLVYLHFANIERFARTAYVGYLASTINTEYIILCESHTLNVNRSVQLGISVGNATERPSL